MKIKHKKLFVTWIAFLLILLYQNNIIYTKNNIIQTQNVKIGQLISNRADFLGMQKSIQQGLERRRIEVAEIKTSIKPLYRKRFLTQTDIKVLNRIVEAEAGIEGFRGKVLVSCAILNRFADSKNKSIKDIVFEKRQFEPVSNGRYFEVKPTYETKKAVQLSTWRDYSKGSKYFIEERAASRSGIRWFRSLNYVLSHGNHQFYRD